LHVCAGTHSSPFTWFHDLPQNTSLLLAGAVSESSLGYANQACHPPSTASFNRFII
jgi:hypothetical protein